MDLPNATPVGPLSSATTAVDETPTPAPLSSSIGMPVKITSGGKGTLATVNPTAGAILDETSSKAILGNMQKMLDEYNDPLKNAQTALHQMQAAVQYGPAKTEAYRQLDAQEEQDRANKYNIGQSMAAMQAMQNQNKVLAEEMGGGANTGAVGTGTAGTKVYLPGIPDNQQDYARFLKRTNPVEFERLLTSYNVKRPDQLKITDEVRGMEDTSQNRALLMDLRPELFKGKEVVDPTTGKTHIIMPDIGAVFKQATAVQPTATLPPSISSVKAELKTAAEPSISSPQGVRNVPGVGVGVHNGIDMLMSAGTPVNSFTNGKVLSAGDTGDGFGKSVVVQNLDGTTTRYAHLSDIGVKPGDNIDRNSLLGAAGQTGNATGPHLHVEVRDKNNQPLDAKGYLANAAKAPVAQVDTSKEAVKLRSEGAGQANQAFIDTTYKDLAGEVASQKKDELKSKQILGSLQNNTFGPGTSIDQGVSKTLQTLGFNGSPEDQAKFMSNLNIEQARKLLSLSGMRPALGAAFTENENKAFTELTPGIDSPKEMLKQYYQYRIAEAAINKDHKAYLDNYAAHHDTMAQADAAWQASGQADKILKEKAPLYYKIQQRASELDKQDVEKAPATRPPGAPDNAKLAPDKNWYTPDPKRPGKFLMWKGS